MMIDAIKEDRPEIINERIIHDIVKIRMKDPILQTIFLFLWMVSTNVAYALIFERSLNAVPLNFCFMLSVIFFATILTAKTMTIRTKASMNSAL